MGYGKELVEPFKWSDSFNAISLSSETSCCTAAATHCGVPARSTSHMTHCTTHSCSAIVRIGIPLSCLSMIPTPCYPSRRQSLQWNSTPPALWSGIPLIPSDNPFKFKTAVPSQDLLCYDDQEVPVQTNTEGGMNWLERGLCLTWAVFCGPLQSALTQKLGDPSTLSGKPPMWSTMRSFIKTKEKTVMYFSLYLLHYNFFLSKSLQ